MLTEEDPLYSVIMMTHCFLHFRIMPRVISVLKGAKWKEGVVAGDFADAELGFLGSFQELLPESIGATVKTGKKKKSKDSRSEKV